MVPFMNSWRIPHALLSFNAAVVEHVVGATKTVVDVVVEEVLRLLV